MNKADVDRFLSCISRVPLWHGVFNAEEVEYLFETTSGWIFCNGRIRNIVADKVTDNCFKVYTKKKVYA